MNVDRNPVIFIVLAVVTILAGTLVTTFIPLFSGTAAVPLETVRYYTPLELEGRDIYIREGCNNCHTQTVRPLRFETERYGDPSTLANSAIDRPHLWGSKRTGPDLANVGKKFPPQWHYLHMRNPQAMFRESNMPPYPWLEKRMIVPRFVEKKMKTLGYPYEPEDIRALDDKTEMDAMVAYLMRLGKEVR